MGRKGSGVEIRANSIRVSFVVDGKTVRERLTVGGKSMSPTPANLKYAHRLSADIKRRIWTGTFSYAEFFPDSKRARNDQFKADTFGQLAKLWLESKGQLVDATKNQYETATRFWLKLIGSDRKLNTIDHKFLAAKIGGYPWTSAKAHNNYLIALRGIFDLEYRGAQAINNPMIGIKNMPNIKTIPDPFSISERDHILDYMGIHYDERITAYFEWMFHTAMRPEEAIALRWSDIDWAKRSIRVQRVRTFRGQERDDTKTHMHREVELTEQAMAALETMKPHTFTDSSGSENGSNYIFQNPITGKPWHDERSQRDHYWKPALKALGIRWRRAYNTRHTFATAALMAGVPAAYIARQLGHSVKTLLEKYARWLPENDSGNARKLLSLAMGKTSDSSQILPISGGEEEEGLNLQGNLGRRDWTRTNDPHHVKVVL